MMGVAVNENNVVSEPEKCPTILKSHRIFEGMLVCHSLTTIDGKLAGDPLDVKV